MRSLRKGDGCGCAPLPIDGATDFHPCCVLEQLDNDLIVPIGGVSEDAPPEDIADNAFEFGTQASAEAAYLETAAYWEQSLWWPPP